MKKLFTTLATLLVVVPLLLLMFLLLVVTLVFACSLAGDMYSSIGVLAVCCVATIAIALVVWRVCVANSLQALQLLRENTGVLVFVVVSMIAIGSACSLVVLGLTDAAGVGRVFLMIASLVELVLCCMAAKRLVGYLNRYGASVGKLRSAVRTLLLISAGLSAAEFCVAMFDVGALGAPIVHTLFEELSFTYGDVIWLELVLACVKFTASISGVILTCRRRSARVAKRQVQVESSVLMAPETSSTQPCDATTELNRDAIVKALAA